MHKILRATGAFFRASFEPGIDAFVREMGWKTRSEREREKRDDALLRSLLPPADFVPDKQDIVTSRMQAKYGPEHCRALAYARFLDRSDRLACSNGTAARVLAEHFLTREAA